MSRTQILPLLVGLVLVVATGCGVGRTDTPEWAKRQLATFERDPIVQLRPPGTELKAQSGRPAGTKRGLKWDESWSTTLSALFTLSGEPGAAVEAYLAAAPGAGWRLFEVRCQRQALEVRAVFGKNIPGFPLGSDVLLTVVARPQNHELGMGLDSNQAPPDPPLPSSAGLPRRDVHCLRGVDLADPRRQPRSATPARSSEELCALVSPREAQAFLPEVTEAQPLQIDARPRCRFSQPGTLGTDWFDILDAATIPLLEFQDRQYSLAYADDGFFLLVAEGHISDKLWGAWIDSPRGPIELSTGPHYSEEAVAGLGRLIQRAALSR
ncbi:MAG: hypothetical protein M3N68_01015 [Actinomycetota bacterium]|nr:hypothetical protein [Actinomycetota bacterium]